MVNFVCGLLDCWVLPAGRVEANQGQRISWRGRESRNFEIRDAGTSRPLNLVPESVNVSEKPARMGQEIWAKENSGK